MVKKKKMLKSRGKWIVATYFALATGLVGTTVSATESEPTSPIPDTTAVQPSSESGGSDSETGASEVENESAPEWKLPETINVVVAEPTTENALPTVYRTIDDRDANLVYNGSWVNGNGSIAGTERWTTLSRANAETRNDVAVDAYFVGSRISYFGALASNHGHLEVLLDGDAVAYKEGTGHSQVVDGNKVYSTKVEGARQNNQEVVNLSELEDTYHSVTIRLSNTLNPNGAGIQVDGFRVHGSDPRIVSKEEVKNYFNTVKRSLEEKYTFFAETEDQRRLLEEKLATFTAKLEERRIPIAELKRLTAEISAMYPDVPASVVPKITTFDERNDKLVYHGRWFTGGGDIAQTEKWSNFGQNGGEARNDVSVDAYFVGSGINFVGALDRGHSHLDVLLDGDAVEYEEGMGHSQEVGGKRVFSTKINANRQNFKEPVKLFNLPETYHVATIRISPTLNTEGNPGVQVDGFRVIGEDSPRLVTKDEVKQAFTDFRNKIEAHYGALEQTEEQREALRAKLAEFDTKLNERRIPINDLYRLANEIPDIYPEPETEEEDVPNSEGESTDPGSESTDNESNPDSSGASDANAGDTGEGTPGESGGGDSENTAGESTGSEEGSSESETAPGGTDPGNGEGTPGATEGETDSSEESSNDEDNSEGSSGTGNDAPGTSENGDGVTPGTEDGSNTDSSTSGNAEAGTGEGSEDNQDGNSEEEAETVDTSKAQAALQAAVEARQLLQTGFEGLSARPVSPAIAEQWEQGKPMFDQVLQQARDEINKLPEEYRSQFETALQAIPAIPSLTVTDVNDNKVLDETDRSNADTALQAAEAAKATVDRTLTDAQADNKITAEEQAKIREANDALVEKKAEAAQAIAQVPREEQRPFKNRLKPLSIVEVPEVTIDTTPADRAVKAAVNTYNQLKAGYEGLQANPVSPTAAAQWDAARSALTQLVQAARAEIEKLPENRRAEFETPLSAIGELAELPITDTNANNVLDTTDRSNAESAVVAAETAKAAANKALEDAQADSKITEEDQTKIREANATLVAKKELATQAIEQVPESDRQAFTDRVTPLMEVDVPEITPETNEPEATDSEDTESETPEDTTVEIDERDNKLVYNGRWIPSGRPNDAYIGRTETWTNYRQNNEAARDDLSIDAYFVGSGISFVGTVDPNHAHLDVLLDGDALPYEEGTGHAQEVNGNKVYSTIAPTRQNGQEIVKLSGLEDNVHVLTLRVSKTLNTSGNPGMQADAFRVTGQEPRLISKEEAKQIFTEYKNTLQKHYEAFEQTENQRTALGAKLAEFTAKLDEKRIPINDLLRLAASIDAIYNTENNNPEETDESETNPENGANTDENSSGEDTTNTETAVDTTKADKAVKEALEAYDLLKTGFEGLSSRPVSPTAAASFEQAKAVVAQLEQVARAEIAKLPENKRGEFETALSKVQPIASLTVTDVNANGALDTDDKANAETAVQAAETAKAAADKALQDAQADGKVTEAEQTKIREANAALVAKKELATQAIAQVPMAEQKAFTDRVTPLSEVVVPEVTVDTSKASKAVNDALNVYNQLAGGYAGLSGRPVTSEIAQKWDQAKTILRQLEQTAREEIAKLPENKRGEFVKALEAIKPIAALTVTDVNANGVLDTKDRSDAESAVQAAETAKVAADKALKDAQADGKVTAAEQAKIREANAVLTTKKELATTAITKVPTAEQKAFTDRVTPLTVVQVPEITPEKAPDLPKDTPEPKKETRVVEENLMSPETLTYNLSDDLDKDGYTNLDELIAGSKPEDKESVPASQSGHQNLVSEDKPMYDLTADADGDGYTNLDELIAGSKPEDKESVPASQSGHQNLVSEGKPMYDLTADTDGDGYTNLDELIAGSKPEDKMSVPTPKVLPQMTPNTTEDTKVPSADVANMTPSSIVNEDASNVTSKPTAEATGEVLPSTGEADMNLIFGATALSILATLGLTVTKRKED